VKETAAAGKIFRGNKVSALRVQIRRMVLRTFEDTVLPHLDAAFNYARWLTRSEAEAEDVVQDACLRAMRYLSSLRDDDARPWLLTIVRNTWYSRRSRRTASADASPFDVGRDDQPDDAPDPEERLLQQYTVARVRAALDQLPVDFREMIVLREIEGMSYKEIAVIVRVPIGTVMSRLARARQRLSAVLTVSAGSEAIR
jgi:RNA polymerase sigma factor (sigma-70 family)